jgi:hypothetical protein
VLRRDNEIIHYNGLATLGIKTRAKVDLYTDDQNSLVFDEAGLRDSEIPSLANTVKACYFDYSTTAMKFCTILSELSSS